MNTHTLNIRDDHGVVVGAEYAGRGELALFPRVRVTGITHSSPRFVEYAITGGPFRGHSASCPLDAWDASYARIDPLPEAAIDGAVERVNELLVAPA